MKEDIKTRWVEALRSGEFVQGVGSLSQETVDGGIKHCCLGVLCELAEREGVVEKFTDHRIYEYGAEHNNGSLPREVVEWADVPANPTITINNRRAVAALHNDAFGMTFEEIAQGIEDSL